MAQNTQDAFSTPERVFSITEHAATDQFAAEASRLKRRLDESQRKLAESQAQIDALLLAAVRDDEGEVAPRETCTGEVTKVSDGNVYFNIEHARAHDQLCISRERFPKDIVIEAGDQITVHSFVTIKSAKRDQQQKEASREELLEIVRKLANFAERGPITL